MSSPPGAGQRLVVLGGTGLVGGRIARLAEESQTTFDVVRVSRSGADDGGRHRRAEIGDPASLREVIRGAAVVVNAVGPFTYDPAPIVGACADSGAGYVDIAEVGSFGAAVAAAARRRHDAGHAFAAVPGASTIPGLVELFARELARGAPAALVRAYLSVGTRNPASATLIASMLDPLRRPLPEAPEEGRGAAAPRPFASLTRKQHPGIGERVYGRYPSGSRGVLACAAGGAPRRLPVEQYFGCDHAVYAAALWCAGRALGRLPPSATRAAAAAARALLPIARALGDPRGTLLVEVLDEGGRILRAVELRALRDGLDVPALPAVWAARALHGERRSGTFALADLVSPAEAAADLARRGVEIRYQGAGGAALGRPMVS